MPFSRPEFGAVGPLWWDDRPCIVVGTGASLAGFDFNRLRGLGYILAVKESWRDLPFADAVFGLDIPWMNWAARDLAALSARMPVYLAVPDQDLDHQPIAGPTYLKRTGRCDAFSESPDTIEAGGNSGFGALNLAFLKRAKRIVLFGYDFGGGHYCEDRYVTRPKDHNARYMPGWAGNFRHILPQLAAAGVTVLNASPSSAIDAFPKVTIDEAVEYLAGLGSS